MTHKKAEFIVPDTRPRLVVSESISLSLVSEGTYRSPLSGHSYYHQAATTEDLENFIRETTRRSGHPHRIDINDSKITASRSEKK